MAKQLVVLLGDSLLVDGVAIELIHDDKVEVIRVESMSVDVVGYLVSQEPDLIVIEKDMLTTGKIYPLLDQMSKSQILGLDPAGCRHLFLIGRHHCAFSMPNVTLVLGMLLRQTGGRDARGRTGTDRVKSLSGYS